jgi:hypothetical protein
VQRHGALAEPEQPDGPAMPFLNDYGSPDVAAVMHIFEGKAADGIKGDGDGGIADLLVPARDRQPETRMVERV